MNNYYLKILFKPTILVLIIFSSVASEAKPNILPRTGDLISQVKHYDKISKLHPSLIQKTHKFRDQNRTIMLEKRNLQDKKASLLVLVDAIAKGNPSTLLNDLISIGLKNSSKNGRIISGYLPIKALEKLDKIDSLNEIKLNRTINSQGSTTTKGDQAQKSDLARRNFIVDGNGIKIGVISDSYNCLKGAKADKETKDLPEQAKAVEDAIDCRRKTDEGRALMQIIHDIAPGADLIFYSGSNGLAKTANGILDLAFKHNVDIIIDDFKSLSANFFQEDPISQAVNRVVREGVVYVTAAGNSGRNSYQSSYNEHINMSFGLNAHDFDPSDNIDIYQQLNVPEGVGFTLALQWDSPAYSISGEPGTQTDLDVLIFNKSHTKVLTSSTFGNIGRDPTETLQFYNPIGSGESNFDLMITKVSGKSPSLFKYIILNSIEGIVSEYQTNSSAIFGHANSTSAITVGATNYIDTPAFGKSSPLLQSYSTAGGTAFIIDLQGGRIITPLTPKKPDVIAPDNVNTTFFGNDTDEDGKPNISGSSAAAPHAAGVIALLLETNPQLQPSDIKLILQNTAVDIIWRNHEDGTKTSLDTGFDFDSGFGLINAEAAVDLAINFQPSPPQESENNNTQEITINDADQSGGGAINLLYLYALLMLLLNRRVNKHTVNNE